MSTIINTPSQGNNEEGMGTGLILGIIIAILIVIVLFFVYGWPAIRGGNNTPEPQPGTNINVTIPAGSNAPSNAPQN